MTAQAAARPIREERWKHKQLTLTVGKIAWQGAAACLDITTGKVVPAASGTNLEYLGVFDETVDATSAEKLVNINFIDEITMIGYTNALSTDAVTATDVGKNCYFVDDQTVGILSSGRSLAGRVRAVDTTLGRVMVQKGAGTSSLAASPTAPAYVANASTLTDVVNGAIYDVPTTAAASTIVLPVAAADGTVARFVADGTKNAHTVQYVDATGTVNITTALTAAKRHQVIVAKLGGKWFANAYVSP